MLKIIAFHILLIGFIACNNSNKSRTSAQLPTDSQGTVNQNNVNDKHIDTGKDQANLSYQKFKNTKWIVNGEQPDTIVFKKEDTLAYISTDTGEELCKYSFDKDTLIYYSHSTESDVNSGEEIICEEKNRLHFENNTFKYIYYDKKCSGDKGPIRYRMDTLDVRFIKLQTGKKK